MPRLATLALACAPAGLMLLLVATSLVQGISDDNVHLSPGTLPTSLLIVFGLAAGIALAVAGGILERAGLVVAASAVLLVAAVPTMIGIGYIVLASDALLVLIARTMPGFMGTVQIGAGALGLVLSIGWLTLLVGAIGMGQPAFIFVALALAAVPAVVMAATFWPVRGPNF